MKQMYKVFLNDRLIEISGYDNITLNKTTVKFHKNCKTNDITNWFNSFLENDTEEVSLIHPEPDRFFRLFQSAFWIIHAAGGVVVVDEYLLFIYRNGKWDLPKGKIDKEETPQMAAIREVGEEAGISGVSIEKKLQSTFHIYQSLYPENKARCIFKETQWFEMSCEIKQAGSPQREEGITEVQWIRKDRMGGIMANTYKNLKQILNLFIEANR